MSRANTTQMNAPPQGPPTDFANSQQKNNLPVPPPPQQKTFSAQVNEKGVAQVVDMLIKYRGQPFDLALVDDSGALKTILQRYDCLHWIFNNENATYPTKNFTNAVQAARFLQKPFQTDGRVPREKILETGCIDWCVAHALNADLIGKYQGTVNNQILVSALLLGLIGQVYLNAPKFDSDLFNIIEGALLGLSTFFQLFCLVAFMAVGNMINQPYVPSLAMYARIEAEFYMGILGVLMYAGVAFFMGSLFFVSYVGNVIDFYITLPSMLLLLVFLYIVYSTDRLSKEMRRETAFLVRSIILPFSCTKFPHFHKTTNR